MRVAFLQLRPQYLKPEQNRRAADALLEEAFADGKGADLVVLPELLTSGYFFKSTKDAHSVAEEVPLGPTTAWLEGWAAETGATLVAGLPERVSRGHVSEDTTSGSPDSRKGGAGEVLYNSAVVAEPAGFTGVYRKVHLYYEEKLHFTAGDGDFPVFDLAARDSTPYRLGLMICFDWFFPEAARTLALKGADVIAHPSNLVRPNCPRAMPIRALENRVFTVTANRTGHESNGEEELSFIGRSEICGPEGELLAHADRDNECFAAVEIDPHEARTKRLTVHNDLWADRRPSLYLSNTTQEAERGGEPAVV